MLGLQFLFAVIVLQFQFAIPHLQFAILSLTSVLTFNRPSSSCLRDRRRTYHTILKLADHANFKMVWYVLLRSLRPELDSQMSFKFMESRLPTTITRIYRHLAPPSKMQ
jgi:hypothetical protein